MNICGKNVKLCMAKNKIEKQQLIVIHDCLETKLGKIKLQQGTSFKGHNGLKSISQELGGFKDFNRIAIGIGRPEERDPATVATFVLSNFTQEDTDTFGELKTFEEVKIMVSQIMAA